MLATVTGWQHDQFGSVVRIPVIADTDSGASRRHRRVEYVIRNLTWSQALHASSSSPAIGGPESGFIAAPSADDHADLPFSEQPTTTYPNVLDPARRSV